MDKIGYVNTEKTYTIEEAAELLHVPFSDLQVICRFIRAPKIGYRFKITKELLKYLKQIHKYNEPVI